MKLLFQNSLGKERVIAEVDSWVEANDEMNRFMEERNFKSHYKRLWDDGENRLMVDVGSWSEFFILEPCCLDDVHKEQGELND